MNTSINTGILPFKNTFHWLKPFVLVFLFMGTTYQGFAQSTLLEKRVTLQLTNVSISDVLSALEDQTGASFSYSNTNLKTNRKVTVDFRGVTLQEALRQVLGEQLSKVRVKGKVINLQGSGNLKGVIKTSDGKPAELVNVQIKDLAKGTTTDENGAYTLRFLPAGNYVLVVNLLGYAPIEREVEIEADQTVTLPDIFLNEDSRTLREVVVSGNVAKFMDKESDFVARMPLKNLENPQVYSVIGSEIIKGQITTDIREVLRNATGAAIANYPSGGFAITTRGFNTGASMRNGMEMATGRGTVEMGNVERIEVLKGPSGTLFGSNISGSFGGVVNVVTKKPFETTRTEIGYTAGSYNMNRFTADVNVPLNEDKTVLLRVNGVYSKQNSFLNYGFNNNYQVAPSLSYKVNKRFDVLIDAEFTSANRTLIPINFINPESGFKTPKDIPLGYKTNLFNDEINSVSSSNRVFVQGVYRLGPNWTTTSLFSYALQKVDKNYQPAATWFSPTQAARDAWVYGPITDNYTNFQQNINGEFKTGIFKHTFLAGVNFRHNSNQFQYSYVRDYGYVDTIDVTVNPNPTPLGKAAVDAVQVNENGYQSPSFSTYSAYASDVINFSDRIYAMLSLRLDRYKRNPIPGDEGFDQTSLSPKLGIVYQVIKNRVSVFANYMNGFQNLAPVLQPNGTILVLDPMYANQSEVGVKMEAMQKRVSLSASYYHIAIDNATRTDASRFTIQDGSQLSTGVEFEVTMNPFPGLNFLGGYAFNNNRITKASDPSVEGVQVASIPQNVGNVWLTYALQGSNVKGLGFGFGANYSDKASYFIAGDFYTPSYTIFNGTVFYEQSRYRLGVKVNNISNTKYWDLMGAPQAPANIVANLTLRF